MLTGKAKLDFNRWLDKFDPSFMAHDDGHECQKVVEWMDSIGIGIDTYTNLKTKKRFEYGCDIIATFDISPNNAVWNSGVFVPTRSKAIKLAIEKANEIYNASQDALKIETV